MDILRRNTDYALRAVAHLAAHYDDRAVSTRQLAHQEDISYQLACKLMQKLHEKKIVKSSMGPAGGFRLSRRPDKISLRDVIVAIQGPVSLNRCLAKSNACPRQKLCPVRRKLEHLQAYLQEYLANITFAEISADVGKRSK
jgi:Rrf2 family protein